MNSLLASVSVFFLTLSFSAVASDVGKVQFPNSGAPEAQADFMHGLAQLHNFEYDEAAADFRRAQQRDPGFALAYWGEAMTYNHPIWMQQDRAGAQAVLERLATEPDTQMQAKTEIELDFIRAVQILYGEGDKQSRDFLYRDHMAWMYEKYPGNPDVTAFYALSMLGTAHQGRDVTIYMKAAAATTDLRARYPQHPGLAHYLIHSTDDPIHAPLGYQAALAYSKIAPNAAHAQHMTSHIFLALGHWEATATANDNAIAVVDRKRAARGQSSIGCGHYPSWQMYAYLQQGRIEEATERLQLCHQRTDETGKNEEALLAFYYMKSLYLFNAGGWQGDIVELRVDHGDSPRGEFARLYLEAAQALRLESTPSSEATADAIKGGNQLLTWLAGQGIAAGGREPTVVRVKLLHLLAWQAEFSGDVEVAESHLRKAIALEENLPSGFGPPRPAKPALEALGELLLTQSRFVDAVEVFKQALARTLNKTRSKHGLALALEGARGGADDVALHAQ